MTTGFTKLSKNNFFLCGVAIGIMLVTISVYMLLDNMGHENTEQAAATHQEWVQWRDTECTTEERIVNNMVMFECRDGARYFQETRPSKDRRGVRVDVKQAPKDWVAKYKAVSEAAEIRSYGGEDSSSSYEPVIVK